MVVRVAIILLLVSVSLEYHFNKEIVAVSFPFYKFLLWRGTCKNATLFTEQQIWAALKLNRILEISYTSNITRYEVSMVEIHLVVNNTEFRATAFTDVGYPYFRAHIVFPIRTGATLYRLNIYTCQTIRESDEIEEIAEISAEEDTKLTQLPFYVKYEAPVLNRLLGYQTPVANK